MIVDPLPTTDLYFYGACHAWVGRWRRSTPIRRIGANSFLGRNRFLLIRRDKPELMERALDWPGIFIYLIDDDIDGVFLSPSLPVAYRTRLAEFADHYYDRLLRRADVIVVSSDILAARLRKDPRVHADVVKADPYWPLPIADQRHFALPTGRGLELAHLGSGSHAAGLAAITPAVLATLDRFAGTRLTFMGSPGRHPELEAHEFVRRVDVMGWQRYRRWLRCQRFHIALYPLEPTPFDRARSANKIFEHAIVGAVGVYPRSWGPSDIVAGAAFLAPDEPAGWAETLSQAIEQRSSLAGMAKTAMDRLSARRTDIMQRQMWALLFDIDRNERSKR